MDNFSFSTKFVKICRICSLTTQFYSQFQAKRTKKVGVVGKYGTRYGASLRKTIKKMEITQHSKYMCSFCGKVSLKWTITFIDETHIVFGTFEHREFLSPLALSLTNNFVFVLSQTIGISL